MSFKSWKDIQGVSVLVWIVMITISVSTIYLVYTDRCFTLPYGISIGCKEISAFPAGALLVYKDRKATDLGNGVVLSLVDTPDVYKGEVFLRCDNWKRVMTDIMMIADVPDEIQKQVLQNKKLDVIPDEITYGKEALNERSVAMFKYTAGPNTIKLKDCYLKGDTLPIPIASETLVYVIGNIWDTPGETSGDPDTVLIWPRH